MKTYFKLFVRHWIVPDFDFHLVQQVVFVDVLWMDTFSYQLEWVDHVIINFAAPMVKIYIYFLPFS